MVNFHEMKLNKKDAVYPQIVSHVKKLIILDQIADYEEMPSRRELALSLSINPNTVQKAYKMLEEEGIIKTISNVKSVICVTDEIKERLRKEYMEKHVVGFVEECKSMHLNFQEVVSLLNEHW